MKSLDDGITWVNPEMCAAFRITSSTFHDWRGKQRGGVAYRIVAVLESGRDIEGEVLGTDADGVAKAARIIADLRA